MAEKGIPEQIVDEFLGEIARQEVLNPIKLYALKKILDLDKPKKAEILKAIREDN